MDKGIGDIERQKEYEKSLEVYTTVAIGVVEAEGENFNKNRTKCGMHLTLAPMFKKTFDEINA